MNEHDTSKKISGKFRCMFNVDNLSPDVYKQMVHDIRDLLQDKYNGQRVCVDIMVHTELLQEEN